MPYSHRFQITKSEALVLMPSKMPDSVWHFELVTLV